MRFSATAARAAAACSSRMPTPRAVSTAAARASTLVANSCATTLSTRSGPARESPRSVPSMPLPEPSGAPTEPPAGSFVVSAGRCGERACAAAAPTPSMTAWLRWFGSCSCAGALVRFVTPAPDVPARTSLVCGLRGASAVVSWRESVLLSSATSSKESLRARTADGRTAKLRRRVYFRPPSSASSSLSAAATHTPASNSGAPASFNGFPMLWSLCAFTGTRASSEGPLQASLGGGSVHNPAQRAPPPSAPSSHTLNSTSGSSPAPTPGSDISTVCSHATAPPLSTCARRSRARACVSATGAFAPARLRQLERPDARRRARPRRAIAPPLWCPWPALRRRARRRTRVRRQRRRATAPSARRPACAWQAGRARSPASPPGAPWRGGGAPSRAPRRRRASASARRLAVARAVARRQRYRRAGVLT